MIGSETEPTGDDDVLVIVDGDDVLPARVEVGFVVQLVALVRVVTKGTRYEDV